MIGKKGGAHIILGFFVLVAIFVMWMVNFNSLECHKNSDCGENSYCSVGNECNVIPVIKEVEIVEKSNVLPAFLIALGLIGFGAILRHKELMAYFKKRKKSDGIEQEVQNEPFYESVSSDASFQFETKSE